MLATLSIRDIVLIDRLDIEFSGGMTVLTGETGAGKSILLDALTLALGGRGDAGLVRHGEAQGQVVAVFDVAGAHPVRSLLRENDVPDDGDVILRRIQTADGRSRAFINDQPVSVGLLRQAGQMLVEVHGQHDERALVDPESHRQLLDAFGVLQGELAAVEAAYASYRKAEKALRDHKARIDAARREADFLRSAVDELKRLDPKQGEEDALAMRRAEMMQVEKIATDLNEAYETLNGGASPIPELSSLLRRLERKADQAPKLCLALWRLWQLPWTILRKPAQALRLQSVRPTLTRGSWKLRKSGCLPFVLQHASSQSRWMSFRPCARRWRQTSTTLMQVRRSWMRWLLRLTRRARPLMVWRRNCPPAAPMLPVLWRLPLPPSFRP